MWILFQLKKNPTQQALTNARQEEKQMIYNLKWSLYSLPKKNWNMMLVEIMRKLSLRTWSKLLKFLEINFVYKQNTPTHYPSEIFYLKTSSDSGSGGDM